MEDMEGGAKLKHVGIFVPKSFVIWVLLYPNLYGLRVNLGINVPTNRVKS